VAEASKPIKDMTQTSWQEPVITKQNDPPAGEPTSNDRYIVGVGTGDWAGENDKIAWYWNGGWVFIDPQEGMKVYATTDDCYYIYEDSEWKKDEEKDLVCASLTVGSGGDKVTEISYDSDIEAIVIKFDIT
jgi:hypothetical protein